MQQFARLINEIDQSNKTNDKINALVRFFSEAEDQDKIWALALFTHRRPKRTVSTKELREWTIAWSGTPEWLFEESYHVVGDLAETISLLLPTEKNHDTVKQYTLAYYFDQLKKLKALDDEQKSDTLYNLYTTLDKQGKFVLTKLITGGWRIGVSQNLVSRALSKAFSIEKSKIAHRLMGDWNAEEYDFKNLILEEDQNELKSRPYPFYLAHPIENKEVPELGRPEDWFAEWKWDGIRGQLIKRGGEIFVWSRGEELVTDKFPEFTEMALELPDNIVLDGEILAYKEGEILPFGDLQTRIGRKNITKKILKEAPVVFRAYDIMEFNGEDIRENNQEQRSNLLRSIQSEYEHPSFQLSERVAFSSWSELATLREQSRSIKAEGFMLKRKDGAYEAGRKRGSWWKWKIEPLTIDGVLIYAQRGHGRRANLYSDYTFGLWKDGELIPFAKAYSGLSDAEMRKVDSFVKKNTKERFGPVRTVTPKLVFEVAFEGIQESKRHKSGISLRFPRIKRWRDDKSMEEANTLNDLQELLEKYG